MNRCQAFRIAIRALEYQRARYKIDANLAEKYGADYPAAQAALAKVQELNSAISILPKPIVNHSDQSRRFENNLMTPRGAPKGNTNALKHGFYSRQFRKQEVDDLSLLQSIDLPDLASEISLLRIAISRAFAQANLAASDPDLPVDWIPYLSSLGLAATRIATLLKAQKTLDGDQDGVVHQTIYRAFVDIAKEYKLNEP